MNYEAGLHRAIDSDPAPVMAFLQWLVRDGGLPSAPRVLDVDARRKHVHVLHREIYLSGPRETAQEKLKTVLRYPVSV